jgi:hypothetical protein
MLERFENTGKQLQFLVQQIAVARAAETNQPVHEVIKDLHRLFDDLVRRVHHDKRKNLFPALKPDTAASVAAALADTPNAAYLLDGALSQYLRDGRSWNEKAVRLLDLLPVPADRLLAPAIDSMLAEMIATPAAIDDFMAPTEFFGDTLAVLLSLFQGVPQTGQYGEDQALSKLATAFAARVLPNARAALAAHIVSQIRSEEPLRGDSVDGELKMLRRIIDHAAVSADDVLCEHGLASALERRAARTISHDSISGVLSHKDWPDDKLDWLFFANDCIVGADNKRELARTAKRICATGAFKHHFLMPNVPLSQRLQRLAYLNARALETDFADDDRRELSEALNATALEIASRAKLFEVIETRHSNPVGKATALLKLFAAGAFTEGSFARKARQVILRYVAAPGFFDFCAGDIEAVKADWLNKLERAGIPSEASLRAFAASAPRPSSAPHAPPPSA